MVYGAASRESRGWNIKVQITATDSHDIGNASEFPYSEEATLPRVLYRIYSTDYGLRTNTASWPSMSSFKAAHSCFWKVDFTCLITDCA